MRPQNEVKNHTNYFELTHPTENDDLKKLKKLKEMIHDKPKEKSLPDNNI